MLVNIYIFICDKQIIIASTIIYIYPSVKFATKCRMGMLLLSTLAYANVKVIKYPYFYLAHTLANLQHKQSILLELATHIVLNVTGSRNTGVW